MQEIIELIKKIKEIDSIEINNQTDFTFDLGFTSLDYIKLIVSIENFFKISIPDGLILADNFKSLGNIKKTLSNINVFIN
jgi:acyl carrier protein